MASAVLVVVAGVLVPAAAAVAAPATARTATTAASRPLTVTNGNETLNIVSPYSVLVKSPGVPQSNQGVITGSGFTAGQSLYIQVCDGVDPATTSGYSPNNDCAPADAAYIVPSDGDVNIDTSDTNYQFDPFHGRDPYDDFFNCLTPSDNPNAAATSVGAQPIDPDLPAWGSTKGGDTGAGGGSAPCQIRFAAAEGQYQSSDIYVPVTGLGGSPIAKAPSPPTSVFAEAEAVGTNAASVSFTQGTKAGTATSYKVSATNKTNTSAPVVTATGAASAVKVAGLTGGDTYTFTVQGINSYGTGTASSPSNSLAIPVSEKPGTPAAPTAKAAGYGGATVTFTAPTTGGTPSSYTVTATNKTNTGAPPVTATGSQSPINVAGLTQGDSYTFTVTASNAIGSGSASPPSAALLIPTKPAKPGAPGKPTVTVGAAGSGDASVAFSAPTSGGTPTSYTVTAKPTSGTPVTATGSKSPVAVTGLTPGDTYTFTVTAANAGGTSPASPASSAVLIPAATKPTITGSPTTATVGKHYDYQMTVKGTPTPTVTETGLPSGMKVSPAGLINGTATKAGSEAVKMTAKNSVGSALKSFTFKVVAS